MCSPNHACDQSQAAWIGRAAGCAKDVATRSWWPTMSGRGPGSMATTTLLCGSHSTSGVCCYGECHLGWNGEFNGKRGPRTAVLEARLACRMPGVPSPHPTPDPHLPFAMNRFRHLPFAMNRFPHEPFTIRHLPFCMGRFRIFCHVWFSYSQINNNPIDINRI